MKPRSLAGAILLAAASPFAIHAQPATAKEVGIEVQRALQAAAQNVPQGLVLKKATLSLETVTEVGGGAQVNFLIFTIGHTASKGTTQTVTLLFERFPRAAGSGLGNLAEPLSRAIQAAAETAAEIRTLRLGEATFKIAFAVSKDSNGKIGFELLGPTAEVSGKLKNASKNSLEIVLARL